MLSWSSEATAHRPLRRIISREDKKHYAARSIFSGAPAAAERGWLLRSSGACACVVRPTGRRFIAGAGGPAATSETGSVEPSSGILAALAGLSSSDPGGSTRD